MPGDWRLLETGLRSAAHNIALDRALLEARAAGEIPATVRFFRTTPTALIAHDQSADQELNVEQCRAHGIDVQRRITGGQAFYADSTHLGWALYANRSELGGPEGRAATRHAAHAVATATAALGIDAGVRRHDEIVSHGRTIGICGSASEDHALVISGIVWVRLDIDRLITALRLPSVGPAEHLRHAAAQRYGGIDAAAGSETLVAELKRNIIEAFESAYETEIADTDMSLSEEARYREALREIDTPDWVALTMRAPGDAPRLNATESAGADVLHVDLVCDATRQRLKRIWFTARTTGTFLVDLESELRETPFSDVGRRIDWFFASRPRSADMPDAASLKNLVARALRRPVVDRNV